MSITAIGPALAIDGPLPVAPEYSLLSVPGVLVADGEPWLNGVNVFGYPADVPSTWEPCTTGTNRTKSEESDMPIPRFDSFVIYIPVVCSARGDAEEFAPRVQAALEARQSYGVELGLSQGVQFSSNPFLGDSNVSVLAGGAAVRPEVGLAYLENAIGATGQQGLIHMDPATVTSLGFNYLRDENEAIVSDNGTPIATGGGYIGAKANSVSAGGGQSWAFASGPVQVRLADVQITDVTESLDRSNNDLVFRAERYVLAIWDTSLQSAVLIDWTP